MKVEPQSERLEFASFTQYSCASKVILACKGGSVKVECERSAFSSCTIYRREIVYQRHVADN